MYPFFKETVKAFVKFDTKPRELPLESIKVVPKSENCPNHLQTTEITFNQIQEANQTAPSTVSEEHQMNNQDIYGEEYFATASETQIPEKINRAVFINPQHLASDVQETLLKNQFVYNDTKQEIPISEPLSPLESRLKFMVNRKPDRSPILTEGSERQICDDTQDLPITFKQTFNRNQIISSQKSLMLHEEIRFEDSADILETSKTNLMHSTILPNSRELTLEDWRSQKTDLPVAEGTNSRITDKIGDLSNSSNQALDRNHMISMPLQESHKLDEELCNKDSTTHPESPKYNETCLSVPLTPQELTLDGQRSREEHLPTFAEKIERQIAQDCLTPLNPSIRICTISRTKSQESTEAEPITLIPEETCNKITDCNLNNKSIDKQVYISLRKPQYGTGTNYSLQRTKIQPLHVPHTSDLMECVYILFMLVIGILAFGIFYFLQGFKPESNTAAALGSISMGIILLLLFCCMYSILKNNGLYCLQKYTLNV